MTYYRATSSLDVVELAQGAVLLRSDVGSCRLEGESAQLLATRVLPRLSAWTAFDDLAQALNGYDSADVRSLLDSLVGSSLLLRRQSPAAGESKGAQFLAEIGIDEVQAAERLGRARVAIAGGTRAALIIAESLKLFGLKQVGTFTGEHLSREGLFSAAGELDLMIVAVDRAMLSARHWANQAALATGCAALFVDIIALEAIVGPLVLPGESGCYSCFKMRHLATSDNFAEMMAHERHLDAVKDPDAERSAFPGLAEMAAGAAVSEAVRLLFPPLSPWLANAVLRIDPLSLAHERHEVLRQPDCPHCRGIDRLVRTQGPG